MAESNFIQYQESKLHYVKAGNGKTSLLFFHGFGQDHSLYIPLVDSLKGHYTVYLFDLYFHGMSIWGYHENPLEKIHWKETMERFLAETGITDFSVAGFSLGGKFALAIFEAFPKQCKKIFLVAPDGINTSFWYSLATYPFAIRKFFKSLIIHPQRFAYLANTLNRFNLVDKGLIRFADYQMNSEHKRSRVYYSWVVFRHLKFDLKELARLMNEYDIEPVIIVGKYDKVIKPENVKKFTSLLNKCRFEIVEAGHSGLLTHEVFKTFFMP
jgi:pimeloyl-ACP methyl ester carboxylesterase